MLSTEYPLSLPSAENFFLLWSVPQNVMSRSENWKWSTMTHLAIDNPQLCLRRQAVYMLMFTSLKINDIQIEIDVLFTYQICLF